MGHPELETGHIDDLVGGIDRRLNEVVERREASKPPAGRYEGLTIGTARFIPEAPEPADPHPDDSE